MSALHSTRRAVLSGATVAAASLLAGCVGESNDRTADEHEISDRGEPPSEATTDFQVRSLRVPTEESIVDFGEDELERPRLRNRMFVLSDEQAASIDFQIEHEDLESIRSFVEGTDYDSASVVVHQRSIDACYTRRVEYVTAQEDRYFVQFCRQLKPATEHCEADETETEALFVRLPRAYESSPSSGGSGERSQCRSSRPRGGEGA